jgi:hypothetical protein
MSICPAAPAKGYGAGRDRRSQLAAAERTRAPVNLAAFRHGGRPERRPIPWALAWYNSSGKRSRSVTSSIALPARAFARGIYPLPDPTPASGGGNRHIGLLTSSGAPVGTG